MKREEILMLYQYNAWANARILGAAAQVTAEQFLAPAALSHGGLCGTLVHTLSAEWIWRRRWEGYTPSGHLSPGDFPTFRRLRDRWQEEESALMAFVENVSEEALNGPLSYRTTSGKSHENTLWHLMAHLVNHGTQHRSEAAILLTDFGHSPGDIDLIMYLRQR
jgi:uncharacterized damage-inducible protein DinB